MGLVKSAVILVSVGALAVWAVAGRGAWDGSVARAGDSVVLGDEVVLASERAAGDTPPGSASPLARAGLYAGGTLIDPGPTAAGRRSPVPAEPLGSHGEELQGTPSTDRLAAGDPLPPPPAPGGAERLSRRAQRERATASGVAALVEALRDDDVKWNATAAADELLERMGDPALCSEVILHLERVLVSDDAQQRRLATGLLQSLALSQGSGALPYDPPDALLDESAELLDRWSSSTHPVWIAGDVQSRKTAAFAVKHLELMEERLLRRLEDQGGRDRFIDAYVLGRAGRAYLAPRVAPVLVAHLRDNYWQDDALMSMEALYRLGDAARPWVQGALASDDEQQRACAELLLLELDDPARTPGEQAERAHLNRVTWKCADPVQSWDYRLPGIDE